MTERLCFCSPIQGFLFLQVVVTYLSQWGFLSCAMGFFILRNGVSYLVYWGFLCRALRSPPSFLSFSLCIRASFLVLYYVLIPGSLIQVFIDLFELIAALRWFLL